MIYFVCRLSIFQQISCSGWRWTFLVLTVNLCKATKWEQVVTSIYHRITILLVYTYIPQNARYQNHNKLYFHFLTNSAFMVDTLPQGNQGRVNRVCSILGLLLVEPRYGISCHSFNSSPPSAAYMRQWIGSTLVQIMVCRLFGAKPLSKPILSYCQMDL